MRFRFYNPVPGDWFEGANDGHLYELRFATPPDAEVRRAIAERFERELSQGPAQPGRQPWRWSTSHARFFVGERWLQARPAFAQVARMVAAIDAIAPLAHAAFLGAREARAWPADAAPGPAIDFDGRAVDPALAPFAEDPGFEAARAAARAAIATARLQRAAAAVDGLTLVPFPEERVPRLAATAMDDARRAGFAVPDPLVVEQPGRGRVPADGDHPLAGAPRPAARVMRAGTTVGIAFLDATGARREVAGLPPDLRVIAFDPAGERGVVTTGRELYEVDFERGEARRRWGSEVACPSVAVLAPYWVVKTARDLVVLDPRGDEVREVARKRVGGDAVYVALDGAVVATTAWKKEVRFVGLCEGKLHTLATLGGQAGLAWVEPADGEVVLGVSAAGGVRTFFAVHGLDALYEAWARPRRAAAPPGEPHAPAKAPAKAKAKAKAGAGAKPRARKPTLEEVAALPEAPAPPAFDDADARALDGGYVIRNARGDVFATLPPPESPHTQEIVTWKRDGAWQQVRFGYLYPTTLAASPDGALIVVSGKVSARTLTADIALRTADGSHATFRDTKEERALGPSRGYVPLGADDVVVRADKGVEWWTRRDGRLQLLGAVSVPGLVDVDVEPARGLVLARSRNKQRLVVLARRDDALVKLGAFTEAVVEVRVVAGEVFVRDAASGRASRLAL